MDQTVVHTSYFVFLGRSFEISPIERSWERQVVNAQYFVLRAHKATSTMQIQIIIGILYFVFGSSFCRWSLFVLIIPESWDYQSVSHASVVTALHTLSCTAEVDTILFTAKTPRATESYGIDRSREELWFSSQVRENGSSDRHPLRPALQTIRCSALEKLPAELQTA